jgi:ABC-type sugar transport system ATPase subunit
MAQPVIALHGIRLQYGGATVLDLPRLEIYDGETLAIIGPNGAGKTSLLKVIGLLEQPGFGSVYFRGEQATSQNALTLRRRMASALQAPLLIDDTVYANAALGLKLRGATKKEIDERLQPWLGRLGIAHIAGRRARTLSGGEARRTSLARALVLEPELLLLDEPFSALDSPSREALLSDLQQALEQSRAAVVIVTHDLYEAAALAARVGVLSRGKLLQLAPTEEIFSRPANQEVAELVSVHNRRPHLMDSLHAPMLSSDGAPTSFTAPETKLYRKKVGGEEGI